MIAWHYGGFGKPSGGPATHHLSIDNVDLCVSLSSSGMGRWLLFDTPPMWMRSCIHQLIRMYLQCVCFLCDRPPQLSSDPQPKCSNNTRWSLYQIQKKSYTVQSWGLAMWGWGLCARACVSVSVGFHVREKQNTKNEKRLHNDRSYCSKFDFKSLFIYSKYKENIMTAAACKL